MNTGVHYSRAYIESRSLPVLFIGNTPWLEEVAKHLNKTWNQLQWAPSEESLKELLSTGTPKVCFIELGAMNHNELRLIETLLPRTIRTIILAPEGCEGGLWQRLERRVCPYGIPALILPRMAVAAAEELTEILEDCVSLGIYNNEEEFALVHAGHRGYLSAAKDVPSKIKNKDFFQAVHGLLMAQFTFTVNEAEAAMLLAETYDYWKTPKPPQDEIHHAYMHLENRLIKTQAVLLLELAVDLTVQFVEDGVISEVNWEMLLERNGLQKSSRKLSNLSSQIAAIFDDYSKRFKKSA